MLLISFVVPIYVTAWIRGEDKPRELLWVNAVWAELYSDGPPDLYRVHTVSTNRTGGGTEKKWIEPVPVTLLQSNFAAIQHLSKEDVP